MPSRRNLAQLHRDEFTGYNAGKFRQDLLAGLTVAAVALPLALAFGVASGASAAAGLVTAILAGVLMVTAWRMNEWESIHTLFGRRFKTAMITFTVTLLATITFDLTQAILIGVFLSGLVYLSQSASSE